VFVRRAEPVAPTLVQCCPGLWAFGVLTSQSEASR
jgi:hypothetical protein